MSPAGKKLRGGRSRKTAARAFCGLVMPISAMGRYYTADHWTQVNEVLTEAIQSISDPPFDAKLVSVADGVTIIHRTIVRNLSQADVIVCDVSGKNPNVMLELGMRLALQKRVVIVKDERTEFSFDTGPIEHLHYESALPIKSTRQFQKDLANKVLATYHRPHESYFQTFGLGKPPKGDESMPGAPLIVEILDDVQRRIIGIERGLVARLPQPSIRVDPTEAHDWLMDAVRAYIEKEGIKDPRKLIGNLRLSQRLSIQHDPLPYFQTPREFREALDVVLRELANGIPV
jgi:hypothetical protein